MSTVIDIPGGTATLRDPDQLKVKHKREIQILAAELGEPRIRAITAAVAERRDIAEVGLSRDHFRTLVLMNEATVYALLESWTLDEPLPRTADDVGEMSSDVYEVLVAECMTLNLSDQLIDSDGNPVDPFDVGAVEHLDSPTGASVGSSGRSATVAVRRAPSDHAKPNGGRSTGTAKRSA